MGLFVWAHSKRGTMLSACTTLQTLPRNYLPVYSESQQLKSSCSVQSFARRMKSYFANLPKSLPIGYNVLAMKEALLTTDFIQYAFPDSVCNWPYGGLDTGQPFRSISLPFGQPWAALLSQRGPPIDQCPHLITDHICKGSSQLKWSAHRGLYPAAQSKWISPLRADSLQI